MRTMTGGTRGNFLESLEKAKLNKVTPPTIAENGNVEANPHVSAEGFMTPSHTHAKTPMYGLLKMKGMIPAMNRVRTISLMIDLASKLQK